VSQIHDPGDSPSRIPDAKRLTVIYPVGTCALPHDDQFAQLVTELRNLMSARLVTVLTVVLDDAHRPLGLTRAVLLTARQIRGQSRGAVGRLIHRHSRDNRDLGRGRSP
jgi:hypothetical protein